MIGCLHAHAPANDSARMHAEPPIVLLDISAVAARLSTTEKQVRNMCARAEFLAPVKLQGLGLRWVERAVDEWIAAAVAAPRARAQTGRPGPKARATRKAAEP